MTTDTDTGHRARTAGWRAVSLRRWLQDVPVGDPVDRRNAPMLQVLALLLCVLPMAAWGMRLTLLQDVPWRREETADLALSLFNCAAALAAFVLVRRGRFRTAAWCLLGGFALTVIPAYAGSGFTVQRYEQPVLAIWIVVAGLTLGRSALWLMFACVMAAFAAGIGPDIAREQHGSAYLTDVASSAAIFLMIALVVDRSSAALRESLLEARARGDALALSNAALVAERAERERVQEQLIHALKVEATGRLASGVAHDFNHLLGLILGHAARARHSDDPAVLKQALEDTESAARRAVAATRKLLSFSRLEESHPETFDLRDLLDDMRPMLRQLFDPAVRIEIEPGRHAQCVRFDRAQFELIVLNLAANAQQAMPAGGSFRIGLPAAADSAEVVLTLADTGHGMSEDVRRRCMEAFFTTKPAGQGTGLGLAVAAQLLREAGGDIAVDSTPGDGSRFRLSLPRRAELGEAVASAA